MTTIPIPATIDEIVEQYVILRDKIKAADDLHKKRTAGAREHLEALGTALLAQLNTIGGDSVKTGHGTVYRTVRKTASIADGAVFRQYVIAHEAFDIVDWKANAPAVEDFIKTQGTPPPGVNFNTMHTVGVRRA